MNQYDLQNSLRFFFLRDLEIDCDIVFDGYSFPDTRPLVTIEQMQNNVESTTKGRESVQVIYRFQIGLHASNAVEKSKLQERISQALLFENIPYFNTEVSAQQPAGYFLCELTAVVPMPAEEQSR